MEKNTAIIRTLLDSIDCVAMVLQQQTHRIIYSNKAAISIGAVPGKTCFETFGQRKDPCPWCRALDVWKTSKDKHIEIEVIGKVWDAYWKQIDENLYIHYAFDITERKTIEQKLIESEEFNSKIIASSNDCIKVLDLEGNLLFINEGGQKKLEIDDIAPYINQSWIDFWDSNDRKSVLEAIEDGKMGGTGQFSAYCPTMKGKPKWWGVRISPIQDAEGNTERLLVISRDITEQHINDEKMRQTEEQLHQAQKMETVGRIAGGIAHDFNNLLVGILGYSELLLEKLEKDNPLRRYVDEIIKAGDRAASLVKQLLAFSRKQVFQEKIINVVSEIDNLKMLMRRVLREDVQIIITSDKEVANLRSDPAQLSQVILNLAINSRDAMPDGGTLAIDIRNTVIDNAFVEKNRGAVAANYVMLTVTDTGCGIDAESMPHIFEPFFTTKEVGKGTGLGLATVYGIVKQSNGYITAHSENGAGTTFTIYLPAVEEVADRVETSALTDKELRGNETILLVEDEKIVRSLTKTILSEKGYNVIEACTGKDALKKLKKQKGEIHLLLTDIVMPGMNGKTLAENIRKIRPDIRILYMSGYTDDQTILNESVKMNNFIQKPFGAEKLIRKVREVLDEN